MRSSITFSVFLVAALLGFAGFAPSAQATRIEELTEIRGVRSNQVTGYGLVVGLAGTGDTGQSRFTLQSTAAMLRRLGATIDPSMIQTKNAAAVIVTATLPPFATPGSRIDVVVSSLGNARSLQGGTLVQTPLYGGNRQIYAVAQGAVLVGGFSASGLTGSRVSENHPTAGRVPGGGIIERPIQMSPLTNGNIELNLRDASFITATRIAEAINGSLGEGTARAVDGATVRVAVAEEQRENAVALLAQIQALDVEPSSTARVVIDERTGTVVLGSGVRISEVAIAQGGLTVEVNESFGVSQPQPFGNGETAVVPDTQVQAQQGAGAGAQGTPRPTVHHVQSTASLQDVVTALNSLGVRPRDLIPIFQALSTAGALHAHIEVQ